MPLAFPSESHGEIAFGFFNVDGDMLLLERTFFFADSFCTSVSALAGAEAGVAFETTMPGWVIESAEDVGDLMGAIHGVRYTGFIGDVYRRFPFPPEPEGFRQHTNGFETRDEFRERIAPWAEEAGIGLLVDAATTRVEVGGVRFAPDAFRELVKYVWRGGWPRWEDTGPPDYVLAMRAAVEASAHPVTAGIAWN